MLLAYIYSDEGPEDFYWSRPTFIGISLGSHGKILYLVSIFLS